MRTDQTGDAFVFAGDPGHICIFIRHEKRYTITVYPDPGGSSWKDFTEKVCRPALLHEGWMLSNWHQPRGNQDVLATAFVWKMN
jgi:hypothetical protein